MSHVSKIELEIKDLDTLKAACERLNLEFVPNQRTYKWYGEHVGDYPLPQGFSIEDMGKCDHAIMVPGASYELGVVHRNRKYTLLWDFYSSGGLERVLGKGGGKLKQAYAVERIRREATLKGYRLHETKSENSVRLRMTL
jgi:hypothetical protein